MASRRAGRVVARAVETKVQSSPGKLPALSDHFAQVQLGLFRSDRFCQETPRSFERENDVNVPFCNTGSNHELHVDLDLYDTVINEFIDLV